MASETELIARVEDKEICVDEAHSAESLLIDKVPNKSENTAVQNNDCEELESENEDSTYRTRRKKRIMIADSDSDEDTTTLLTNNESDQNVDEVLKPTAESKHKKLAIIDSDSESETEGVAIHNKSFSDDLVIANEKPVFITNSEGVLVPENVVLKKAAQQARLSLLCDPDSSEEEIETGDNNEESPSLFDSEITPKELKTKRTPKKKSVPKPKKMTGKQAIQLKKEIKSASQRMLREKNVSLPYHKPKSYTLKEFLSRRPKFASSVPINTKAPPSVALKMCAEQLTLVSKKLKEREKEVKEFYKSESESEDDREDKDYVPPTEVHTEVTPEVIQDNTTRVSEKTDNVSAIESITESEENKDVECSLQSECIAQTISEADENEQMSVDINLSENVDKTTLNECDSVKDVDSDTINTIIEKEIINQTDVNDNSNNTGELNDDEEIVPETGFDDCNDTNSVDDLDFPQKETILPSDDFQDKEDNNFTGKEPIVSECSQNVEENIVSTEILATAVNKEQLSMDYEFTLDDLEDNSEIITEKEHAEDERPKFEYTDLDREIENFGSTDNDQNDPAESTEKPKNLSKLELIKQQIGHIKPKLSGNPHDVIDLESGIAKPNEVTKLMERFLEHNFKKTAHKNKVELSIVSIESGEIHKETVAMKLDDDNEAMVVEEKPGAKLQKLRDELQNQMAQKRSEFWHKKVTATSNLNEKKDCEGENDVYEGEKDDCGLDDDILDDEEEEMEMTESSEEEAEEDAIKEEKKKSVFIDEEAEESDVEDEEIVEATSENEDDNEADDENEIDDISEVDINEDITDLPSEDCETEPVRKPFRKIIKGFAEDSDEEDVTVDTNADNVKKNDKDNCTPSQEDDVIPPHQAERSRTPIKEKTQSKSDFGFLTPISYITGLQNLNNSTSKFTKDSPVRSPFQIPNEPSPLKEDNWQRSLQEKLDMNTEITDSQVAELCSGKFPETQEINEVDSVNVGQISDICNEVPSSNVSDAEKNLMELCSGKFPTTAVELPENRLTDQTASQTPSTQDLLNICSGQFTGITQSKPAEKPNSSNKSSINNYVFNTNNEVKSLDEGQDVIISQLLDEEEMEKFKKRFESPLMSNTQKRIVEEFEEGTGGGVIDSDDDDTGIVTIKKKNQKKLTFSDDEESENENADEEVIDLHDDIEEDDEENIPADEVAYDSEENEIDTANVEVGTKLKPSDFFENEAELSESDWDSADEDEKDLDTMEFEQGDTENYDEKQIRSDLEKIHMRRLLDDDTREVKLLQEMLLEDGELHGSGRERQFRWKNIDSITETDEEKKEDDDVYFDEEESEEQWRKRRHEREMFLKEKLKKSQELGDDDLLSESQLLKIGQKVIQRSHSNSQSNTPVDKTSVTSGSPVLKQPFTLLNKRGSFLSRSDEVLQRLAEYNKVTSVAVGTAKNSRNFLFQTVTVEQVSVSEEKMKKRKAAADGTPNVIKKLRLSNNLSPAVKKKPSAKAKLFSNW